MINNKCKICKDGISGTNKVNGHLQAGKTLLGRNAQGNPEELLINISKNTSKRQFKSSIPYSQTDWCMKCEKKCFEDIDNKFMNFYYGIDLADKFGDDIDKNYYRIHNKTDHNMIDKYAMSVLLRYYLNGKIDIEKKYEKLAISVLKYDTCDNDKIFQTITVIELDRLKNGLTNTMSPDITNKKYNTFCVYSIYFKKDIHIQCKVSNQQFPDNIMNLRDPDCLICLPHLGSNWKHIFDTIKNMP